MVSPQPAGSVCGRPLLCGCPLLCGRPVLYGRLVPAAGGLLDCWSEPGSDVPTSPNLRTDGRRSQPWTSGGLLDIQQGSLLDQSDLWTRPPLEDSSSIGCLKAVMSLKVQRKRTTLSCSFLIGAIFTKNQTGVPVWRTRPISQVIREMTLDWKDVKSKP